MVHERNSTTTGETLPLPTTNTNEYTQDVCCSSIRRVWNVTVPPYTYTKYPIALANSIETPEILNTPLSYTYAKWYDVPPPTFKTPPSIVNCFDPATFNIYSLVKLHV
jgi:hypothetical protein